MQPYEGFASQNIDELVVKLAVEFHMGDGDDYVHAPHAPQNPGSQSEGYLGRGHDVVELTTNADSVNWKVNDFELGLDSIIIGGSDEATQYRSRQDIISLFDSPGGLEPEFLSFIPLIDNDRKFQQQHFNGDRIFVSGVSPLLTPELLLEPGTIDHGDSFDLHIRTKNQSDVHFEILGLDSTLTDLSVGDWSLSNNGDSARSPILKRRTAIRQYRIIR